MAADHPDAIGETAGPPSLGRGPALTPPSGGGSSSSADPGGSYLDVNLRYGGCGALPLCGDIDPHLHHQHHYQHHPASAPSFPFSSSSSSSSSSSRTVMPSRQFHGVGVVIHAEGLELCGESAGPRGFRNGWDGNEKELSDSPRAGSAEFAPRWWSAEAGASAGAGGDSSVGEDTVPVIVTSCQQERASSASVSVSAHPPVSIISTGRGRHKGHAPDSAPLSRAKTVRFADEMTSWTWCDGDDDDAADSSDDTGLSSLHDDDVLETLV